MILTLETSRIGFIGAGRLAKALAWHCAQRGLQVAAVANRSPGAAEDLAAPIAGCTVVSAQQVVDSCSLVFVTTPDGALRATVEGLQWRAGQGVVHCSGATEVGELAHAARQGAAIGGFHPLQTFGDPAAAARSLPGCTVTIEAADPLDALLVALAQHLGCSVNRLPPGARPLYHAAAGYASQFVNVLLREAVLMWQAWDAREEDAVRALLPLVQGTLASIGQAGLAPGMPGPVSRGDVGSVHKHVQAIARFDPEALALYRALCGRTVDMALAPRRIDEATAARLRGVLAAPAQA